MPAPRPGAAGEPSRSPDREWEDLRTRVDAHRRVLRDAEERSDVQALRAVCAEGVALLEEMEVLMLRAALRVDALEERVAAAGDRE